MTVKRKPEGEPHCCTQEETIKRHNELLERTNKILYGNGTPKEGLIFRFDEFMKDHKQVVDSLVDIKTGLSDLRKEIKDNATATATAQSAIEKFKIETESYSQGVKEQEARDIVARKLQDAHLKEEEDRAMVSRQVKIKQRQDSWQRVIWIIMALIALYGIFKNNKKMDTAIQKVDNLGAPVLINSRGATVPLEGGTILKMYPKDFDTKKDSTK